MAKISTHEAVISTSRLNSYGSRVLTEGIDLEQYRKNPVLLYMHQRCFDGKTFPLGFITNLRVDGDRLIGTPVFDEEDPVAMSVYNKWERGFLRMVSAGLEIVETSKAPEHLLPGQRRETVSRSRLEEVSIVDIGANDDALQLTRGGQVLELASGGECEQLPLLLNMEKPENPDNLESPDSNNPNKRKMNKETLALLGLGENAGEQEVHEAVRLMKEKADKAANLELAGVTAAVERAVKEKRITADKKDHFIDLGKKVGLASLEETLSLMRPEQKPSEVIVPEQANVGGDAPKTYARLSEVPEEQLREIREKNRTEYARLYKAEYGVELPTLND
mgnify:FL=1